jgi:hypothetical protein
MRNARRNIGGNRLLFQLVKAQGGKNGHSRQNQGDKDNRNCADFTLHNIFHIDLKTGPDPGITDRIMNFGQNCNGGVGDKNGIRLAEIGG